MNIRTLLEQCGISSPALLALLEGMSHFLVACLIAWLAHVIAKRGLARLIVKIIGKTAATWDDLLFDKRFFNRLAILVIPIGVNIAARFTGWQPAPFISHLLDAWIVLYCVMILASILAGVNRVYKSYPVSRDKPIKVFIQVVNVFFYCMAGIIIIGIFTGKDITTILTGLAAFAAVLMLVFKDSILGLVAGIQLSANNMARIGDWIVMPACNADGEVLEINLTTVKVQNWDKTITTIPTYKLVSDAFTNWRGMEESSGRRIKRSVNIDVRSIHHLDDSEIETLRRSSLLKDYI
jgi:miniconductance mechanosensitive channel